MKTKKLILGLVTSVLGIVASIFGFLKMFNASFDGELAPSDLTYGFFGKEELGLSEMFEMVGETYSPAFRTIAGVLAILIAVATVAYMVLLVLDLKKGTQFSAIRKIVSIVLAALGVLVAISLLIYVCGNSVTASFMGTTATLKVVCTSVFGAIALTVFPVAAGACGFMAEK